MQPTGSPAMDLSLAALYQHAPGPVKLVMLILGLCSLVTWAIIFEKVALLPRLGRQAARLADFGSGKGVPEGGAACPIIESGRAEGAIRRASESVAERADRVAEAMRDTMVAGLVRAETRLSWLAVIGSSAPFIGLFGTVWGIMHAFVSIARMNNTSFAVVAPGIAESLSTTAFGLVAAIPAMIAYNQIAAAFNRLERRMSVSIDRIARRIGDEPLPEPATEGVPGGVPGAVKERAA